MDVKFWTRKPTSPALNFDLANLLSHVYDPNPQATMPAAIPPEFSQPTSVRIIAINDVCPQVVILFSSWGAAIFIGGTQGTRHVAQLIAGWSDTESGPDAAYGACPAYALAARSIFSSDAFVGVLGQPNVALVGHSYGGAVCYALTLLVANSGVRPYGVWTYGAPRPGNETLQTLIRQFQSVRWFADDDPVRWIPPHSDEASIVSAFGNTPLAIGMNEQTQMPIGYEIDSNGITMSAVGDPGPLHAVSLSIAGWVTGVRGFANVNHAVTEYRRRFQAALPIKPDGPARPLFQPAADVGTIRPREIASDEAASVPAIEMQLADPTSEISQEVLIQPTPQQAVRYHRKRQGPIWVVRYGDATVDIGPGKRTAGRKARALNRVLSARQASGLPLPTP